MSILYCALILNKEKVKVAESSNGKNFQMQIQNKLTQIFQSNVSDRIEFENYFLTFTRSKELIYLCVSPTRIGEERPRVFLNGLINKLNSKEIDISEIIFKEKTKGKIKELCMQNELKNSIDLQISNFNSGLEDTALNIKELQKDVDETKAIVKKAVVDQANNITNLKEGLLTSAGNIKDGAKQFKRDARDTKRNTRFCCKPWVIRVTIVVGVILLLILIYIIVAFSRCETLNAFC